MEKYDLAEDHAKEAILLDSTHAAGHISLGYIYAMQNRFDEAELYAQKAVELDSNYYNYNLMAWILIISDKDIDRGIQMALNALETRSVTTLNYIKNSKAKYEQPLVYKIGEYVIGLGYLKKGDYNQALDYLEKAHLLLPHREDIKSDLEKAKKQLAKTN